MQKLICRMGLVAGLVLFSLGISFGGPPRVEIASSPNPVGSGARALGMGGAFIAIADDATAASWNPGGLIQLDKPEISIVLGHQNRSESISFATNSESSGDQSIDNFDINYLSAAFPFVFKNRNMIVSLNYQRLYDFNRKWVFYIDIAAGVNLEESYEQEGELYALGLAYSTMVTLDLSVGITLNYWGDVIHENQWKQTYNEIALIPFIGVISNKYAEQFNFKGWNANLGFLWRISEHWTLGGVLKLPFQADVDHKIIDNGMLVNSTKDTLDMPMAYGFGLAYRFSDKFTISADLYRTHWEDFIYQPENDASTSPVSGKLISESDIDATTWFRLGAEYLYIGRKLVIPIRGGIFYDPAPAEGSTDEYYGFALGSGLAYKQFIWDISYQLRYGDDVGGSMLSHLGFSQDVKEHSIYTSLIVHF
jgi:long-subunit fatty acid transport protein